MRLPVGPRPQPPEALDGRDTMGGVGHEEGRRSHRPGVRDGKVGDQLVRVQHPVRAQEGG